MQIIPHLAFNGDCEKAFGFYKQCFGGEITAMSRYEGTPAAEHVPAEWRDKIMHAELHVDGQVLMGADAPPGHYHPSKGMMVSLMIEEPGQAERIFQSLAEGGKINMPLQETFWAARFGMCVDRFGVPWAVNCANRS
jgi:PhnB protein